MTTTTTSNPTIIDTGKVTDHRKLRFNTLDDLLAEVDRIVAADQAGRLRRTGNWTAGQIFGHLAAWMNYSYEGYPKGRARPPWFIRVYLRMRKKSYMRDGMPRGVKIPGVEGGTFATEPLSTQEGAQRLRSVIQRAKKGEPALHDSPAFGKMSEDDRITIQLRHAEAHLGFLKP